MELKFLISYKVVVYGRESYAPTASGNYGEHMLFFSVEMASKLKTDNDTVQPLLFFYKKAGCPDIFTYVQ